MRLGDPGARRAGAVGRQRQPQVERLRRARAARWRGSARRGRATVRAWRAAIEPIETWSSWLALVGIESTDAGWARTLFSETRAAAVYW